MAAPESFSEPVRILFVGNSFTFMPDETNRNPVTPAFVRAILNAQNIPNDIEAITAGGHTLENHWVEGHFQKRLQEKHFDYVFIQPYSVEALELPACFRKLGPSQVNGRGPQGREHFLEYAQLMIQLVRSKGSIPIVIEPWMYDPQHAWLQANFECLHFPGTSKTWFGGSPQQYQKLLNKGYTELRNLTNVEILRVGTYWQTLRESQNPELPMSMMYMADHYHPTALGAYLSALLIAERLTQVPAAQFRFCPDQVKPKQEAILKRLAMQALLHTVSSK